MADPEEVKRTLLDFVSSQLTAHAATIIGLFVAFFTSASLFTRESFLPRINFSLAVQISTATFGYVICWLSFWIISAAVLYSFMRLMYYGAMAHAIIAAEEKIEKTSSLRTYCQGKLDSNWYYRWFSCGIARKSKGFWSCLIVGLIISVIMFYALFLQYAA